MAQFYPDEIIQEVRANNDIVDIVSEYIQLKRVGNRFVGLCPFHKEKTPSFSVSQDKQLYHCFGCKAGGTVINFIMDIENLDFVEAIKLLAERARMDLPEGNFDAREATALKHKQMILKINKEAARFFFRSLNSQIGNECRKYLKKRELDENIVKRFGLGYAPNSWNQLIQYLISQNYTIEDIIAAGLAVKNKDKNSYYDRFRNRLMFPIIDIRGNIIGFGGRVLDGGMPKYLNSPETIVFNKSRNLYGLNYAKNSKNREIIIVEGYMDVISLHQNGIINTIASLGTALTQEQARLIKKFSNEVIIAYDSDVAGQEATIRGLDVLNGIGCKVKVISLGDQKDPDEYIKSKGVESFKEALKESKTLIEYKIDLLKRKYDLNNIDQKVDFVNEMAKIFVGIENAVERDAYIQKIGEETGVSSQAIFTEVKKLAKGKIYTHKTTKQIKHEMPKNRQINNTKTETVNSRLFNAEKMLLNVLCYDKNAFNKIRLLINPIDFTYKIHKKIASIIYKYNEQNDTIDPAQIVSHFEGGEVEMVTSILHMETNFEDNIEAAMGLLDTIKKEKNRQEIELSLKEGDVEKLHILLEEYKQKLT